MTDERRDHGQAERAVFDDDRLLACALGLDDDPELLAAATGDPALAARLDAARSEVDAIEAGIHRAVPAPDDSYADLSGDRWAGLRDYLEVPAARTRRRGASRWLRIAAPVAALVVIALAVGITTVGGDNGAQTEASRATLAAVDAEPGAAETTPTFKAQLDRFAVVVLAKAREVTGAVQRFDVMRVLKGDAPGNVMVDVGTSPARRGRVHLLLLRPLALLGAGDFSLDKSAGATASVTDGPGRELRVAYTYDGEPCVARELPANTDVAGFSLP